MRSIKFFVFFSCLSFVCVYGLLFLSLPLANTYPNDFYMIKDYINQTTPKDKNRILLMSYSDGMFGIKGKMFEDQTDYAFVNYALFDGVMPFDYRIDKLIASAKRGDIILLPLNFESYKRNEAEKSPIFYQSMLLWGEGRYKESMFKNPLLLFKTLAKSQIQYIPKGIFQRWKILTQDPKILIAKAKSRWNENKEFGTYEGLENVDPFGEYYPFNGTKEKVSYRFAYLTDPNITDYFIKNYKRLEQFAKENEILVCFTYPPTIKNSDFDLDNPKHNKVLQDFKNNLAQYGIKLYGNAKAFQQPRNHFYDTQNHPNATGARIHTQNIINALKECLQDKNR